MQCEFALICDILAQLLSAGTCRLESGFRLGPDPFDNSAAFLITWPEW
jgi:hypothetical protein